MHQTRNRCRSLTSRQPLRAQPKAEPCQPRFKGVPSGTGPARIPCSIRGTPLLKIWTSRRYRPRVSDLQHGGVDGAVKFDGFVQAPQSSAVDGGARRGIVRQPHDRSRRSRVGDPRSRGRHDDPWRRDGRERGSEHALRRDPLDGHEACGGARPGCRKLTGDDAGRSDRQLSRIRSRRSQPNRPAEHMRLMHAEPTFLTFPRSAESHACTGRLAFAQRNSPDQKIDTPS